MRILLDTNAYTAMRRDHAGVIKLVRSSSRVLVSSVVAGELLYGFRRGKRFQQNRRDLMEFVASPFVDLIPVTMATAERFGIVRHDLALRGKPIPTNDVWIAAHALESGADLVSMDAHFGAIGGLVWIDPSAWA